MLPLLRVNNLPRWVSFGGVGWCLRLLIPRLWRSGDVVLYSLGQVPKATDFAPLVLTIASRCAMGPSLAYMAAMAIETCHRISAPTGSGHAYGR